MVEEGSDQADALWDAADIVFASRLLYPEARAALAAAARAGRIGGRALRTAVSDLDGFVAEMRIIEIDDELARRASELAERHVLRAYDAVHLASALSAEEPELVIVTWDTGLSRAASEAGVLVAPPGA